MAEQAVDVAALGGGPLPPSPTTSLSDAPSSPSLEEASQALQDRERTQPESVRATEYILDVIRRKRSYYDRKSNLELHMDSKPSSKSVNTSSKVAKPTASGSDSHTANKPSATKPETPANKPAKKSVAKSPTATASPARMGSSPVGGKKQTPRLDRAGNPRPPNKRFLARDVTGKLVEGIQGPDTQLEEVQAWIKDKKHTKFEMLPDASEYTFDDIDVDVRTEPYRLKNQGRKLLLGKDEEAEVWAILPVHPDKIYQCRFLLWDGAKGTYTAIASIETLRDSLDELNYPWEAFTNSAREDAWMQLQSVIGYVFLLCGEAEVAFTGSAKNPGSLSTALTHIKETYAPNDAHPTAATVDRTIQADEEVAGDLTQLEMVNELLDNKKLLDSMQRLVSDPSVYVFKDFTPNPALKVKGISKVHNRMLFLGENNVVETWAVPSRSPNKAILGWIINTNKKTGEQECASWWPKLPMLTFPFEAYKEKGDFLSWRKVFYTVGYIFLCCGEAKVAVNMATSFRKHFISISVPNTVEKHYGSVSPPTGWPHVRKPGDLRSDDEVTGSSKGDQVDASIEPPKTAAQTSFNKYRKALQEFKGPNTKPSSKTPLRTTIPSISVFQDAPSPGNIRPVTYTAPAGEYRSLDDLGISLFLEKAYNGNGKRSVPENDDKENRLTKHKRLEAERVEATKLRVFQARTVERIQRELDEHKQKLHLLEGAELDFMSQMGGVMTDMTDEDYAELDC